MAATRTRSKGKTVKTAADAVEATETTKPRVELGLSSTNPPKLFILPKDASPGARIVTLVNPKDSSDNRYFHCPEKGLYEFTKLSSPSSAPRSWLISQDESSCETEDKPNILSKEKIASGYVMKGAELFVATPVDPLFFVLPALCTASPTSSKDAKRLFLAVDDYWDAMISSSGHFRRILRDESGRKRFELRMAAVCDTVDAGDEQMYRLNEQKLFDELMKKALRIVEAGLPESMEEKLVRKALDVPLIGLKNVIKEQEDSEVSTPLSEVTDSQNSTSSTLSEASTAATSIPDDTEGPKEVGTPSNTVKTMIPSINAPEGIPRLLRIRTALSFMFCNYVTPQVSKQLKEQLAKPDSAIDFTPLDAHLKYLADLRNEARAMGERGVKRSMEDNEEGWEDRAEKKRKLEEEEKRKKANRSVGLRKLEKVNTSGMKKMSDFFKKK